MLAEYLSFYHSNRHEGRGQSIFDAKRDNFDALDEAWSQWVDALRSGRSRTYIPECLIPRDENGVYAVPKEQILSESRSVYGGVTELFPFLEFPDTGVKAVRCSRIMSIMGFTGVYFACVGESNVNVNSPACLLPSTIAHELAHQRGIAWEQECNFLGVLASVTSGMPDYAYSGWLLGFIHLGNALYETDPEAYRAIRSTLPPEVNADLRDNNAYWDQFRDNVVEKVTDTVYDAALKSYGDANGMQSYSMVVELLVAYYKDRI